MESLDYPEHLGIKLFKTNFILTAKSTLITEWTMVPPDNNVCKNRSLFISKHFKVFLLPCLPEHSPKKHVCRIVASAVSWLA